jgi:hypothetical protein
MSVAQKLSPAQELVATNTAHFPNESVVYRAARNALLSSFGYQSVRRPAGARSNIG